LTSFLDVANRECPAAASVLVLWAHGSGLDNVHDAPVKPPDGHPAGPGLGPRRQVDLGRRGLERTRAHRRSPASGADRAQRGARLRRAVRRHATARHDRAGRSARPRRRLAAARRSDRYGCRWGRTEQRAVPDQRIDEAGDRASALGKVDVLALNACWMGALEVEYEMRNIAAFEVACQVYARPWSYGAIISSLVKAPAQSAEQLARGLVAIVHDEIKAGKRGRRAVGDPRPVRR